MAKRESEHKGAGEQLPADQWSYRPRGRKGSYRGVFSPRSSLAAVPPEERVLAFHVARIVGELTVAGASLSRRELASRVGDDVPLAHCDQHRDAHRGSLGGHRAG